MRPAPGARAPGRRRGRVVLLVAALVAAPLAAPVAAEDESIGVTPTGISILDAQPGETYLETITVQNEFDTTTRITLDPVGEVGDWTRTEPTGPFEIPARTHRTIDAYITVPADAFIGPHEGFLRVTAEAKEEPNGSGYSIRWSVAVTLDVIVGGDPVVDLGWVGPRADDVEIGTSPKVSVGVVNEGNTQTTARAEAEILPHEGDEVLAAASASVTTIPGERERIAFPFETPLPEGQYRVRIASRPDAVFEETVPFKVVPPGMLGKDGRIRYLDHAPRADVGEPVKIVALFENTGNTTISRAKLGLEARLDGSLVEVLGSDGLVAPSGRTTNLTVYFTPDEPGRYRLVGVVNYDGFETPENEGVLTVGGMEASAGATTLLVVVLLLAGVGAGALWLRRRGPG